MACQPVQSEASGDESGGSVGGVGVDLVQQCERSGHRV